MNVIISCVITEVHDNDKYYYTHTMDIIKKDRKTWKKYSD